MIRFNISLFKKTVLPILLGVTLGIATFYPITFTNQISLKLIGGVKRGNWITHFDQSMEKQNPWLRNYVAFNGLLGSIRPEIIYLETMWDDEGEKISGEYDYILSGTSPECRYWSFVIYDYSNRRMEPYEETVANSYRTDMNNSGSYEIVLTAHPENYSGKYVINHSGKDFTLTMRVYGPVLSYYEQKESMPVGSVTKVMQ